MFPISVALAGFVSHRFGPGAFFILSAVTIAGTLIWALSLAVPRLRPARGRHKDRGDFASYAHAKSPRSRCRACQPVSWRAISSISFSSPRSGRTITVKLTSLSSAFQRSMSMPCT